jgi:hypothetical protein
MKNKVIKSYVLLNLFLVIMTMSHFLKAQDHFQITLRYGILSHTPGNLPDGLKTNWQTSSNSFDLILDRNIIINKKYKLNTGLGFSVYRFINSNLFYDGKTVQSNYGILKYGIDRKLFSDRLFLNINIFHYILAHKEKQDDNQRRTFTNIDFGLSYKISNSLIISMGSPYTLYPMFLLRVGTGSVVLNEPVTRYNSKVQNRGIHFGISYKF